MNTRIYFFLSMLFVGNLLNGMIEVEKILDVVKRECEKARIENSTIENVFYAENYSSKAKFLYLKKADVEQTCKYRESSAVSEKLLIDLSKRESKKWEMRALIQHELGHIKNKHHCKYSLLEVVLPYQFLRCLAYYGYRRHQEWEADEFVPCEPEYLNGAIRALKSGLKDETGGLFSTHPSSKARIDRFKERLSEYYADTWSFSQLKSYLTSKLFI